MLARLITLRFDPLTRAFDDAPLREWLAHHEAVSLREQFFEHGGEPYMAVFVAYRPPEAQTPAARAPSGKKPPDESWRELLGPDDLPLFNALRDWRSARSRKDGVPPYVVMTNRQLATVAAKRPHSIAELSRIEGFGAAKRDHYGRELLGVLGAPLPPPPGSDEPPAPASAADAQPEPPTAG